MKGRLYLSPRLRRKGVLSAMSSTRPRITVVISLFLSWHLILLLCAPFSVSGAYSLPNKRVRSTQEKALVRYREGEILVRFRSGVSEKDKETIMATHGAQKKKQLKGTPASRSSNWPRVAMQKQWYCNCCSILRCNSLSQTS